jgi:hypothetical protein
MLSLLYVITEFAYKKNKQNKKSSGNNGTIKQAEPKKV